MSSAYSAYAAALLLATLAVFAQTVCRRHNRTAARTWLVALATTLGLAEAARLAAIEFDRPLVLIAAEVLLQIVALTTLVEYDRSRSASSRSWQRRWAYAPLLLAGLVALALRQTEPFVLAVRVLLLCQGAWILGRTFFFTTPGDGRKPPQRVAASAALAYLTGNCLALGGLCVAALAVVVAAVWLTQRATVAAADRGSLLHQGRWPALVCVLLLAGWFLLGSPTDGMADQPLPTASETLQSDVVTAGDESAAKSAVGPTELLERTGLTVAPILLMFGLLWLLSRSRLAH